MCCSHKHVHIIIYCACSYHFRGDSVDWEPCIHSTEKKNFPSKSSRGHFRLYFNYRRAIGPTDAESVWIALADISGDGNADVVATTPGNDTIVGWYEHEDGVGSFSEDAERITAEVQQLCRKIASVFSSSVL